MDRSVSRTFYLIGGNGAPNFGDEFIADAWISHLLESHPDARIILDCNSITTPVAFFDRYAGRLHCVDGFKRLSNGAVREELCSGEAPAEAKFAAALDFGLEFFERRRHERFPQIAALVDTLQAAESVHIFGGGYINTSIAPFSGFLLGVASAIRRAFGARVFGTGLGVTPLHLEAPAAIASLRRALSDFDLFECRDAIGHARLAALCGSSAALIDGLDDSFLRPARREGGHDGRRRLHLSFIRKPVGPRLARVYRDAAAMAADFDEVCYWHCAPRLPDVNMERFADAIPGMRSLDCRALVFEPLPAAPGDFMIAQRFHPHLIGARLGCAGAYLVNSEYYADKHGSVVALGSPFVRYRGGPLRPPQTVRTSVIMAQETATVARKGALAARCYG